MSKKRIITMISVALILVAASALSIPLITRRASIVGDETFTEAPADTLSPDELYPISEADWEAIFEQYGHSVSKNGDFVNTPYYTFLPNTHSDNKVYSKVSQTYVSLCPDPFCTHEERSGCQFGGDRFVEGVAYLNGRIYVQTSDYDQRDVRLLSFDKHLSDLRVELDPMPTVSYKGTASGTIISGGDRTEISTETLLSSSWSGMQADGDCLYFSTEIHDEDGELLRNTVVQYDPATKQYDFINEATPMNSFVVRDGTVYATKDRNLLISCDVATGEVKTLVEAEKHLTVSVESVRDGYMLYGTIDYATPNFASVGYTYDLQTGETVPTAELIPDGGDVDIVNVYRYGDAAFCIVDHSGEAYKDDPGYDFYTAEDTAKSSSGRAAWAGRIYRLAPDGSVTEIAQLTTKGIPDMIWWPMGFDGRMLYVSYQTYLDYPNSLCKQPSYSATVFRNAAIDTLTGKVYKLPSFPELDLEKED
ncbi:MAG: hypothetical protein J6J01_09970 [Oscillospiraceae bacterium]|nr:hypothetical protein [Clostridia bacterium]MBP3699785.1 hypothetical protein [Oscillospiraceae bacterium]